MVVKDNPNDVTGAMGKLDHGKDKGLVGNRHQQPESHPSGHAAKNSLRTGKDPNLDKLGNSLSNKPANSLTASGANGLASPLTKGNDNNGIDGSGNPGANNGQAGSMKSGLPDSNKDKGVTNQSGLPGMSVGQSGVNGKPSSNGVLSGLKSAGEHVPDALKNAGSKAKGGYGHVVDQATSGIIKLGKKSHVAIKKKTARIMVHVALASSLGGGIFGAYYVYNNSRPLDSGSVCTTQNNGSQSYSDAIGGGGSTAQPWTQPGSTQYKNAKAVAQKLQSMGFSGNAIAGIMGNMAQESGFNTGVLNSTGDGGKGLMQWTGIRRQALESFAQSKHMDSGGLELQLLMMEKDLRNPDMWQSAYKKISPTILSNAASPADAAARFFLSAFEAGQGNTSDPAHSQPAREAFAQQAYASFNLSGIHSNESELNSLLGGDSESTATSNSASAEGANAAMCNGTSNKGDTSSVVSTAESLLGYFTYSQGNRTDVAKSGSYTNISSIGDVKKDGQTDCSGYVWLVLKLAGYSVPDQMWFTGSMDDYMKDGKYLKSVAQSDAKAGTVIFTDGSGDDHAAILLENYHGAGTKMINEGGAGGDGGVNESTIADSFGIYWNHYHFANPIKK